MADIKIPAGPPGGPPIEATTGVEEGATSATDSVTAAETAPTTASDEVTRIAEDLAAGRITGDQAVERIIAETMGTEMVQTAPQHLRDELAATLENLIKTDPHLRSLARGLGASSDD
jgi:hypothetical protein